MNMTRPNYYKYFFISIVVILIDQTVKMLVHFNMNLGEEVNVLGSWFRLHYVLNPGMAFGLEIGITNGKLLLTLFRLIAMAGIGYYLYLLIKRGMHHGLLVSISLILGGAIGNVIDSTFYGVLLEGNAPIDAITPWFHGKVIDMLYFPIIQGIIPDWVPFWGGDSFLFFRPVFNIADSSIFIGVAMILIMQKKFFAEEVPEKPTETDLSDIELESLDSEIKKV